MRDVVFDGYNKQMYFFPDNMMMSRVLSVQMFFLILGNSFALDGCNTQAWRCGDTCIESTTQCKCGDKIFARTDQKWCCHKSCTGKGKYSGTAFTGFFGGVRKKATRRLVPSALGGS